MIPWLATLAPGELLAVGLLFVAAAVAILCTIGAVILVLMAALVPEERESYPPDETTEGGPD